MCYDKIDLPSGPIQISSSLFELCFIRHFFFPPGHMIDPEPGSRPAQRLIFFSEIRVVRIKNPSMNIMASGASESKEPDAVQLIYLAPHQMNHILFDILNLSAMPFLHRQLRQHIVSYMVSVHPQKGKKLLRKPFPLPFLLL